MDKGICALERQEERQEASIASDVSYMLKGRLKNGCHLFLEVTSILHAALVLKTFSDPNVRVSSYPTCM